MVEVVTVACKLRSGLLLRTFRKERFQRPVIGGGMREVDEFLPTGQQYRVHGNTAPFAQQLLDAEGEPINMEQSFALTHNVPKAFWELWLEQNKDSEIVKKGLIFAHSKPLEVRAMAKEFRDQKHGLEPIDVHPDSGDLRNPARKGTKLKAGQISKLATADVAADG